MNKTKNIAFCGLVSALSIAICLIGSLFTVTKFIAPIIAGLIVVIVIECIGIKQSIITYVSVSILLFIVLSKKSSAIAYILLFGYYPIIHFVLEKSKVKMIAIIAKLFIFLSVGTLAVFIGLQFMPVIQERNDFRKLMAIGIVLYIVFAIVYDLFLKVLFVQFRVRLKPRFDKIIKK